ncbi:MAG: hypothetical protein HQK66_06880 [Desulfamplus sp.]|nr:hypothetical protein [Desulfamplus sp.]
MAEPIENRVTRSLKAAQELYHRLVLIVGKGGSGKTSVVQNLAKLHHTEPININLGCIPIFPVRQPTLKSVNLPLISFGSIALIYSMTVT